MGRYTYTEPVKHAIKDSRLEILSDFLYSEEAGNGQSLYGWTGYYEETEDIGDIYGVKITKGKSTIYYINESEYSHVGGYEHTVFSDNEEALKELMMDLDIKNYKIISPAAVKMTI